MVTHNEFAVLSVFAWVCVPVSEICVVWSIGLVVYLQGSLLTVSEPVLHHTA